MNPQIKTRWITALLSGKYKQGKEVLRRKNNTFCCLGVLCDLYIKENGGEWKMRKNDEGSYSIMRNNTRLPRIIQRWAGINSTEGSYYSDDDETLANDNDSGGKGFKTIAKIIEKYF